VNGWASERFGYRYTVMGCLVLITGFIAIFFTAQNIATLQVAGILAGVPWGVFQTREYSTYSPFAAEHNPLPQKYG
jgi:SP family general alpha glucoside:H+ symporter-like MFS transporter